MNLNFAEIHDQYLVGRSVHGSWVYEPFNAVDPAMGGFLASHQAFSNNALQVALFLYNKVNGATSVAVKHCVYLNFTRKESGTYLLNNDADRLTFQLDLGVCADLYALMVGQTSSFRHRVVRSGKTPKEITGLAVFNSEDRKRVVTVTATGAGKERPSRIPVEVSRADQIAIAAYCISYCRLLYPSLSDAAAIALLSDTSSEFRACAKSTVSASDETTGQDAMEQPSANAVRSIETLRKAVWAIGMNKWPRMDLNTLKTIQNMADASRIQLLVDQANAGDFTAWDAFL